jgi:outer membrane protein assembly factor BamB
VGSYGNDGRTGEYATRGLAGRPEVAWRAPADGPVVAAPLLVGGLLVVAAGGRVCALDAGTGAERWSHEPFGDAHVPYSPPFVTAPVAWRDWLIVTEQEFENVYVYDAASGAVVRTLPGDGCATVVGDTLLLDGLRHGARALRLPDWQPLWSCDNLGSLGASPALAPNGVAYAAHGFEAQHGFGGVTAFVVATGAKVFEVADRADRCPLAAGGGHHDDWISLMPGHVAYAEGLVWAVAGRDHDGWMTAEILGLDPSTGLPRWTFGLGLDALPAAASVSVAGATVYFATEEAGGTEPHAAAPTAVVRAVDLTTRAVRWSATVSGAVIGAPVLVSDVLYQATTTGTVHALERRDGAHRWSIDTGAPIPRSPDRPYDEDGQTVVPADGMLYVRTADGIVALREAP